jgi:hypothetical protein
MLGPTIYQADECKNRLRLSSTRSITYISQTITGRIGKHFFPLASGLLILALDNDCFASPNMILIRVVQMFSLKLKS